jgi:hypothetical protein
MVQNSPERENNYANPSQSIDERALGPQELKNLLVGLRGYY